MALTKKEEARQQYLGLIAKSALVIEANGFLGWLGDCQGDIADALAEAGLPDSAQLAISTRLLALYDALGHGSPSTSRELDRELLKFESACRRLLAVSDEVDDQFRDFIEREPDEEGNPVWLVHDPMAKARCSIRGALTCAAHARRPTRSSGPRISATTLAIEDLVEFAVSLEPSLSRPALTHFISATLSLAIESFRRARRRDVREPRWGERVGEALHRISGR